VVPHAPVDGRGAPAAAVVGETHASGARPSAVTDAHAHVRAGAAAELRVAAVSDTRAAAGVGARAVAVGPTRASATAADGHAATVADALAAAAADSLATPAPRTGAPTTAHARPSAAAAALAAAAADALATPAATPRPAAVVAAAAAATAGALAAAAAAADTLPPAATIHCHDRSDIAAVTEALCVFAPFSAATVAAAAGAGGRPPAGFGPPTVACGSYSGTALPADKANCSRLVAGAAAVGWFEPPAEVARPGQPPTTPPPRPVVGSTGPAAVLLRLASRDTNIAHAAMKLTALHHVLRHPHVYGLPPSPAVVVHLSDRYIAPVLRDASSWQAGLLATVLAASPVGRVTITESLADTPATYAVAAVVGSWSNRFSVGDTHEAPNAAVNDMARADHAALHAALPAAARPAAAGGDGGGGSDAPLRIVYMSRSRDRRRKFDAASEARLIDTLHRAAAPHGAAVEVVSTSGGGSFAAQVAAVAGADVVVGLHGAALTTVVVGAWSAAAGAAGGTLVEVRPYGFRLRLFDGAAVVGAYAPVELVGHGAEFPGRRRRAAADGGGWRESALSCAWRDFGCFEFYRDAVQVFGGADGAEADVVAVHEAVVGGLLRARQARGS